MIFIIVAVQKDLTDIKSGLAKRGFEVVDPENYNYPIDALVFEGNSFQISHISRNNMPSVSMGSRSSYGVFLINAAGKSLNEIEDMLNTRSYSPLF